MRAIILASAIATGCIVQQPQPAYTSTSGYASNAYANPAYQPGATAAAPPAASALPPAPVRRITFNAVVASEHDLATIDQLEQRWGGRLPSGDYWYDNESGAAGRWGGPTMGILPPGLQLGGPLPANASGGGDGSVTGVFINGRELHPQDVAKLQALVGEVYQGRWFVDPSGNFGLERGGVVLGNLYQLAAQHGGGTGGTGGTAGDSYYSRDQNGSAFVGGGCVSVDTANGSYYGSGC